jgi:DNA-directed RNA polymerase subunit RPC12/RpoP
MASANRHDLGCPKCKRHLGVAWGIECKVRLRCPSCGERTLFNFPLPKTEKAEINPALARLLGVKN